MSCNSCLKTYSLLRPEKGCPGCGFSFCSKCINNKIFLEKVNSEVKVCNKCKNTANCKNKDEIAPPDSYFKRIAAITPLNLNKSDIIDEDPTETEIRNRLLKLKDGKLDQTKSTDKDIEDRLKILKNVPSTSQAELEERLAKLRNVPVATVQTQPVLILPDKRTEEEQANDLLKQYMENSNIDKRYNDEFDEKVNDIQMRLQNLKGSGDTTQKTNSKDVEDSEDEDEIVKKIIEKAKQEAVLDEDFSNATDELPFCEICNEDAKMRCCGCKYLFCRRCFLEHRDEDDGCDKYENYIAPKSTKV